MSDAGHHAEHRHCSAPPPVTSQGPHQFGLLVDSRLVGRLAHNHDDKPLSNNGLDVVTLITVPCANTHGSPVGAGRN